MCFKLIVDSCCELTPDLKDKPLNAAAVPLLMTVDNQTFVDNESLDVDGFIRKMNEFNGKTTSACPSPQAFNEQFEDGKTNFVVTISSQLSGSFSSASVAKDIALESGKDVHVFDSKSASAGELLVSLKIKELVEQKLDKAEIINAVEEFISGMKTFFVLENLDNLLKNGRMSKLAVKLTTLLGIRPILGSDGNGNIALFSKARGAAASIEQLCKTIGEYCTNTGDKILAITHCNNEAQAARLKAMAEEMYTFKEIIIEKTRGLSSMYANNGGIIIAF
jgi:DegV family protein with EDD domain